MVIFDILAKVRCLASFLSHVLGSNLIFSLYIRIVPTISTLKDDGCLLLRYYTDGRGLNKERLTQNGWNCHWGKFSCFQT